MIATVPLTLLILALAKESFGASCGKNAKFAVVDSGLKEYPSKLTVFGIPILATSKWKKGKLNHVASVLAQLIDNDNDGCPDDPLALDELRLVKHGRQQAVVLLDVEPDKAFVYEKLSQTHYSDGITLAENQVKPSCSGLKFTPTRPNDPKHCQDAAPEELFHFVSVNGYGKVYPDFFGTSWDHPSKLTELMDIARGGRFKEIPKEGYPSAAWYHYNEPTCGYSGCQSGEYIWWGYCAYSGICKARDGIIEFEQEFEYLKKSEFKTKDSELAKLFQDSALPTKAVNGKYRGCETCASGGPGLRAQVESKYF